MSGRPAGPRRRRPLMTAALFAIPVAMVGVSFAMVPLYSLFCRVTGYGGTTQVADAPSGQVLDRTMRIRFTGSVNSSLPWRFAPEQREVSVKLGQGTVAFFRAQNVSDRPTAGTAVYNVTPEDAALYFTKTQCFCFTEQHLDAGQPADMPVYFYVDPALADDRALDDLRTITLSYTFYPAQSDALDQAKTAYYDAAAGATVASSTAP